ncbi:hypothetical protein Gasu2_04800 [Galdieria sulphuraria]|nr:hypothetical protein Gasu2_04800 [Galdieria sulphuraria]
MPQPVQQPLKQLTNEKRQPRVASNKAKQAISNISQGFIRRKQPDVSDENQENSLTPSFTKEQEREIEDNKGKKRNSKRPATSSNLPLTERTESDHNQQYKQLTGNEDREKDFAANQIQSIMTSNTNEKDEKDIENVKTNEFIRAEQTKKSPKSKKERRGPTIGQVLRMRSFKPTEMNTYMTCAKENVKRGTELSKEFSHQVFETTESHKNCTVEKIGQEERKEERDVTLQQNESAKQDFSSQVNNAFKSANFTKQRKDVSPTDITNSGKLGNLDKKVQSTKGCKDNLEVNKQKESVQSTKLLPERYPWEQTGYADGVGMSEILSEEEIAKECVDWTIILQSLGNDWNHRAATLKRIRVAISKPFINQSSKFVEILSNDALTNALITQTTDLRSSLVKEAFETIATVSEKLGDCQRFWFVASKFLEKACLASVVRTTKVIAVPAEECGQRIVASTPAEAVLPVLCSTIRFGSHPVAREKATNYLLKILKRGRPLIQDPHCATELEKGEDVNPENSDKTKAGLYTASEFMTDASALECLRDVVISSIGDSQGKTREAGLCCLNEMKSHWPDYTTSLLESLDPSLQRRAVNSLSTSSNEGVSTKQKKEFKTIKELKAEARQMTKKLYLLQYLK